MNKFLNISGVVLIIFSASNLILFLSGILTAFYTWIFTPEAYWIIPRFLEGENIFLSYAGLFMISFISFGAGAGVLNLTDDKD